MLHARNPKNKTNINCLTGAHKWKSMGSQIFSRFINLLFVFPLYPFDSFVRSFIIFLLLFLSSSSPCSTFAIYGFDKWKFQSSKNEIEQKMCIFPSPGTFSFLSRKNIICFFYYISTNRRNVYNISHLKWSNCVVALFLFICFVHLAISSNKRRQCSFKYFK